VFRVETDNATIKTFFANLTPRFESMPGGEKDNCRNEVFVPLFSQISSENCSAFHAMQVPLLVHCAC
jgi:hypothetical protein